MKPPPLPHHREDERPVDSWEEDGIRHRLVARGHVYRVEVWHLYRWEASHQPIQALARRLDALKRAVPATVADVADITARRAAR